MRRILCFAVAVLGGIAMWAQVQAQVVPVPIPGGDVVPPAGLINAFSPGDAGAGLDGLNADPHVITNFRGVTAMGYTLGVAEDNNHKSYQVVTDIRVYQGEYIGAQATFPAGGTTSGKARGTFVEI